MRYLALIFLLTLAGIVPAKAQQCVAKDQVVEAMPDGVLSQKLTPAESTELRTYLNGTYPRGVAPDGEGYSYVVTWVDDAEHDIAVIFVFDEHNCGVAKTKRPKAPVLALVGEAGS